MISTKKNKKRENFNVFKIQRLMLNRFKYDAIFIKDFVYLTFIAVLLKNTGCLVSFIAEQFKRLPKNRKQFKLLTFINQTLKIFCQQRKEIFGVNLQITGRLNRRNRTHKWVFKKGNLAIQTYITRVEYGYSEGLTRSGLIGIKLWIFYHKFFKRTLKQKILQYLFYSKNKQSLNKTIEWNNYRLKFLKNSKSSKKNKPFSFKSLKPIIPKFFNKKPFNKPFNKPSVNKPFANKPSVNKPSVNKPFNNPFKPFKSKNPLEINNVKTQSKKISKK